MEKKSTLEIFAAKASAAMKRKKSFVQYTLSFPSFEKLEDENGEGPMLKSMIAWRMKVMIQTEQINMLCILLQLNHH